MKNLILHYVALLLPFLLIIMAMRSGEINPYFLIFLLILWSLLYAPYLNGRRLYLKKAIEKKRLAHCLDWAQMKTVYFSK